MYSQHFILYLFPEVAVQTATYSGSNDAFLKDKVEFISTNKGCQGQMQRLCWAELTS